MAGASQIHKEDMRAGPVKRDGGQDIQPRCGVTTKIHMIVDVHGNPWQAVS
jgi:hypothetical protein